MTRRPITETIEPAGVAHRADRRHRAPGAGRRPSGLAHGAGFRRPGGHCLDRLYGPRQFRHQHPGRRQIRLWAVVGRAARQCDGDAVPGPLRQARHRHRQEPRRNVPRSLSAARGLGDVGGQRNRRHGDRPRRIPRRRHRPVIAAAHAAACRNGGDRDHHLRPADVREIRLPAARTDHRLHRRRDLPLLSRSKCSSRRSIGARRHSTSSRRRSPTPKLCCSRSALSAPPSCRTRSICIPA